MNTVNVVNPSAVQAQTQTVKNKFSLLQTVFYPYLGKTKEVIITAIFLLDEVERTVGYDVLIVDENKKVQASETQLFLENEAAFYEKQAIN